MIIRKEDVFYIDLPRKINVEKEERRESVRNVEREKAEEELLRNALQEAEIILKEAKEKAEEIIEEAKKKADFILQQAKEVLVKVENEKKEVSAFLSKIRKIVEEKIEQKVEEIVQESLAVLKVLYRKILEKDMDDEVVTRKLRSVLKKIMDLKEVVVRVNPEDMRYVDLNGLEHVKLVPDPSVEKGGIVVETNFGVLDKTFSYQWKLVEDIFEEVFGFEGTPPSAEGED